MDLPQQVPEDTPKDAAKDTAEEVLADEDAQASTTHDGQLKLERKTKNVITGAVFLYSTIDKPMLDGAMTPSFQAYIERTNRQDDFKRAVMKVINDVRNKFFHQLKRFAIYNYLAHRHNQDFLEIVESRNRSRLAHWYKRFLDMDVLLYLLAPFTTGMDLALILSEERRIHRKEEKLHRELRSWARRLCSRMACVIYMNTVLNPPEVPTDWKIVNRCFDDIWKWRDDRVFALGLEDLPAAPDFEKEEDVCLRNELKKH